MEHNKESLLSIKIKERDLNRNITLKKKWDKPSFVEFSINQTLSGNVPAASESAYDSTHSNS